MGHCGPSSMRSPDFGKARVCIRAAAHGCAPMVSRWGGSCHVSGISHSFGSQCVLCRFGRGCNGTSHKVGCQCSRGRFRRRYIACRACRVVCQYCVVLCLRAPLYPVRPPISTYLGHVLAHPTQEDTAWDMITTQLHHNIAAYRTLPLNAYKKVAIIKAVLTPRWTYRGLFLGNGARMALCDDILLQYIKNTPGIEQQMNKHGLTTNLSHGGLGLRQLWWSYITRWVTLGQQELQRNGPTQQLTATQYEYIDAVRAVGGTVGQRICQTRQHRPLSAGLYDSGSSEEDQEAHAGKIRPATNCLDYGWMHPPDEPTPQETHDVY